MIQDEWRKIFVTIWSLEIRVRPPRQVHLWGKVPALPINEVAEQMKRRRKILGTGETESGECEFLGEGTQSGFLMERGMEKTTRLSPAAECRGEARITCTLARSLER